MSNIILSLPARIAAETYRDAINNGYNPGTARESANEALVREESRLKALRTEAREKAIRLAHKQAEDTRLAQRYEQSLIPTTVLCKQDKDAKKQSRQQQRQQILSVFDHA